MSLKDDLVQGFAKESGDGLGAGGLDLPVPVPLSFNPADKVKATKAKGPKKVKLDKSILPDGTVDPILVTELMFPDSPLSPGNPIIVVQAEGVQSQVGVGSALTTTGTGHCIAVALPGDVWARLCKVPTGTGGWQTLMARLRAHTSPDQPVCYLPAGLYADVADRAVAGAGGYQSVARHLICLSVQQSLKAHTPTPATPGSLPVL